MTSKAARETTFFAVVFLIFLSLVLIFGAGSYTAALGSDPFGIVHFAQHLARGKFYSDFPVYDWARPDWDPSESRFVLGGNYIKAGPRMYNKYTIGFPLLLALSIRVLGENSFVYCNLIILLLLLLAHFQLAWLFLRDRPGGRWLALAAPLMLLVMVDHSWRLAMRPSHDLAGIMFVVSGAALAVRALGDPPRIRVLPLLVGAFAFGCAGTLRLPNVLAALPAGGYFLARTLGRVRWWKLLSLALAGVALFFLALSPALVQNQLTTGHPLRPPRPEIVSGERTVLGGLDQESPPPLWIGFFPTTFPEVVRYFWRLWGPLFVFLGLLGLISLWRRPETGWLLFGIPLILVLFYSMWVHIMYRYMLAAHPFLIVLITAGIGRLFRVRPRWWSAAGLAMIVILDYLVRHRAGPVYRVDHLDLLVLAVGGGIWLLFTGKAKFKLAGRPAVLLAAVLFCLFTVRYGVPWLRRPALFQLSEAQRLGSDIDSLIPPESVIFSTKPVFQYINLYSSCYSIRPFEMSRIGVEAREGFHRLLARGTGLYILDNSSYKRDSGKSIPLFREYFDVTPAGKLSAGSYNLAAHFGKPVCTLYRIEPWSEKELKLDFDIPDGVSDMLLAFSLRNIHDPARPRRLLEVEVNGRPLPGPFCEGLNFFPLPPGERYPSPSILTVRSDLPLPRDLDLRVFDPLSTYVADLAGAIRFPDKDAADFFTEQRLRDGDLVRLGWGRTGAVSIPTMTIPGTFLIGEVQVQKTQKLEEPISLAVALNGQEIARLPLKPGTRWEKLRFSLPESLISSSRGELEFTVDRPRSRPLSLAEENSGSLLFRSVSVHRLIHSLPLALEPENYCFLAFSIAPPPGDDCPGPYRVLVGGEEVASGCREGVQRLLLRRESAVKTSTRLEVRGDDGSCRPMIVRPFLLWFPSRPLRVDVGGGDDRLILEEGFYHPEIRADGTRVRWTKGEARFALPVIPREGKELTVTLKVIRNRPAEVFRSAPRVDARLGDIDLGGYPLEEEDASYTWTIPGEIGVPRIDTLTLRADTWRPSRYLPSADNRELGIMLEWIQLEYRETGE